MDTRKKQLADAFAEVARSLGRRPTLSELDLRGRFSASHYLKATGWGSWYGTLKALDALTTEEVEVQRVCGEFLKEVETTSMTRSYKMVVLQAMLERAALPGELPLDDLVEHFRAHFSNEANRGEVLGSRIEDIAHGASDVIGRYIVDNPVDAWIGGNTGQPSPWFTFDPGEARFGYIGPRPGHRQCFLDAVSERAAYRLMQYRQRRYAAGRHFRVVPNGAGACIMLGNDASYGLPRGSGWQLVRSGNEYFYAKFSLIAINVIKRRPVDSDDEPNLIVEVLKTLFNDADLLEFSRAYRLSFVKAAGDEAWRMVAA